MAITVQKDIGIDINSKVNRVACAETVYANRLASEDTKEKTVTVT